MNRLSAKAAGLALLFALLPLLPPGTAAQLGQIVEKQATNTEAEKEKQEETKNKSKLMKTHFVNGNQAMQDAQAIRQQLQTATNSQKSTLLAKMKADYQTAITEYQQSLEDTRVRDENSVRVIGLLGIKGEYQEAITMLQQAAILKPAARTYIELGTDLARVGRMQEATATCDKIQTVEPAAKNALAACYKNIAIVLMNEGKLGDALSSTVGTKSEDSKIVYVIPAGTIEAYQKYLQLEPGGPYAGQVQATLEEFARLTKRVSTPTEEKEKK
jgi:tetratricopeptide (TPR) repeat protein